MRDAAVPEVGDMTRGFGGAHIVVRFNHIFRRIQRYGGNTDVGALDLPQPPNELVILRNRRRQDDPEELLVPDDFADIVVQA